MKADRELFGRLLISANARQINLREVLSYELSPALYPLFHLDGSLRKTTKSVLSSIVEDGIITPSRLPVEPQYIVYVFDGRPSSRCTSLAEHVHLASYPPSTSASSQRHLTPPTAWLSTSCSISIGQIQLKLGSTQEKERPLLLKCSEPALLRQYPSNGQSTCRTPRTKPTYVTS